VRVVYFRDEFEKVNNVYKADFKVWEMFTKQSGRSEGFERGHVAAGSHDDVGVAALVIGCPVPDSETFGAVLDSGFHVEELQVVLFICDDDVDVVGGAETVVCDGEEAVTVGRKVDADDFGGFIGDDVEESGVLMRETVVVLAPDGGG